MDKFKLPPLETLPANDLQHLIDYLNGLIIKIHQNAIPRYVVDLGNGAVRRIYDVTVQATIDSIQTEISMIHQTKAKTSVRSKAINGYSN